VCEQKGKDRHSIIALRFDVIGKEICEVIKSFVRSIVFKIHENNRYNRYDSRCAQNWREFRANTHENEHLRRLVFVSLMWNWLKLYIQLCIAYYVPNLSLTAISDRC